MPLKLLPLAWRWMNALAEEWSCYWTLAFGSLVRYWELPQFAEIGMTHPLVEELVYSDLQKRLMVYENCFLCYRQQAELIDMENLQIQRCGVLHCRKILG